MNKKYKNILLVVSALVSLIAGIHLLISPETVSLFVIRAVGFSWIIQGIGYALDLGNNYLKNKLEDLED